MNTLSLIQQRVIPPALRGGSFVALVVAALVAAGCGDSEDGAVATSTGSTPSNSTSRKVAISLSEFKVVALPGTAPAGMVTFDVTNNGKVEHEFIVAKTNLAPGALPTGNVGDVDEGGAGLDLLGEIPDLAPGKAMSQSFDMRAGKYVLFCNISGHYKAGQYTRFSVN